MAADYVDLDEIPEAAQVVTIAVWGTPAEGWQIMTIADLDPWSLLGLLREAYVQHRDYVDDLRFGVEDDDEGA